MKTLMNKWLVAGVGTCLLGGGVWVANPSAFSKGDIAAEPQSKGGLVASKSIAANERAVGGSTVAPTAAVFERVCNLAEGLRDAWRFESTSEYSVDLSAMGALPTTPMPESRSTFEGELQSQVLRRGGEGSVVLVARWVSNDRTTRKAAPRVDAPFLVELNAGCQVTGYARLKSTDVDSARVQQASIFDWAFSVPRGETGAFSGRSGFGEYDATVRRRRDSQGSLLVRELKGYRRVWGSDTATPHVAIKRSTLAVHVAPGVWFDSFEGEQEISAPGVPAAKTVWKAVRVALRDDALAGVSLDVSDYEWVDLLPQLPRQQVERTPQELKRQQALATKTYAQAMEMFADNLLASDNIEDQWRDLTLYLEARPELISMLQKTLRYQQLPSKAQEVAFLSLSKVRGVEAKDALRAMAADTSLPPMDRVRAAISLASRNDVGAAEADAFLAQAKGGLHSKNKPERFYARNALLAAGMVAGVSKNPEAARAVRQAVEPHLGSSDKRLSRVAFAALGNVGNVQDLGLIERWSYESKVEVRTWVPQALRRMPLAQVGRFELEWLRRETAPDVKRELWHLLDRQLADERQPLPDEFISVAISDLKAQHPALTRQSLIKLLSTVSEKMPEAKAALLAQAPIEFEQRSGLYAVIAESVGADELYSAMGSILSPAGQPEGPGESPRPSVPTSMGQGSVVDEVNP